MKRDEMNRNFYLLDQWVQVFSANIRLKIARGNFDKK